MRRRRRWWAHTAGRPTDRRYEHVTGEDETRMSSPEAGSARLSAAAATRWHWRVPFAKVKVFPFSFFFSLAGEKSMQCNTGSAGIL